MADTPILVDDSSIVEPSPSRSGPMSFGLFFRLLIVSGALILLTVYAKALAATPELRIEGGDVVISDGNGPRKLTQSGRDDDPVLSPDGTSVVFTRKGATGANTVSDDCASGDKADQLRRIGVDGNVDEVLLTGMASDKPEAQVCRFAGKHFTSDGALLYFLSPAWATSPALHVYDMRSKEQRYLLPATDLIVLSGCEGEHKDQLIIEQHRYLAFGGSYDWYWLYDANGKEIAPVGEFANAGAVLDTVAASGQCGR